HCKDVNWRRTSNSVTRIKGKAKVKNTVPKAPLHNKVVIGSSSATRRVVKNCTENSKAVIKPKVTPIGFKPLLGRITISTPINPTMAANQRDKRMGSPSAQGAMASISNGAKKLIAVASAWGKKCSAVNNDRVAN